MDVFETKLKEMGYALPAPPEEGGSYAGIKPFGENLLYVSGSCADVGDYMPRGKLGKDITVAQGQQYARETMLNVLSMIKARYGTLDVIQSFVKIIVFVACTEDFYDHPAVANGATDFLIQVFGDEIGRPARSAVGMYVLPDNLPVEIECLMELKRGRP